MPLRLLWWVQRWYCRKQDGKDPRHWQTVMAHGHVRLECSARTDADAVRIPQRRSDELSDARLAPLSGDWIPLTLPEQMRERLNETMDIISWVERPSAPSGRSTTR